MSSKAEEVVYKNIVFRRYPKAKRWADRSYYVPSSSYRKRGVGRLHQEVWKDHHGEIPEGCEIHHKDGNVLNNAIENLECLTVAEHNERHRQAYTPDQLEERRKWFARAGVAAANWHSSEAGLEWHRELGNRSWESCQVQEGVCAHCGASYTKRCIHKKTKYCSNNCRAAARRASKADFVERSCAHCAKPFQANKYNPTRYCSRSCVVNSRRGGVGGSLIR